MLIASLSSIPPRFEQIAQTLDSLLCQKQKFDEVRLYIPYSYRRFPEWDGLLPDVPEGVEIRRCHDWGPATKVLGAVSEMQGQDVQILFCDDDRRYDPNLTARVLAVSAEHPGSVIAENGYHLDRYQVTPSLPQRTPRAVRRMRITDWRFQLAYLWQDITNWSRRHDLREPPRRCNKRSGYVDIFEGSGAVLVRPNMFGPEVFDIPDIAWSVDDVWLSAHLESKGVPIWLPANVLEQGFSDSEAAAPLSGVVNDNEKNRSAVEYLRKTLGIWQ